MYTYNHKVRVRYAETDQMGYLHHAQYAVLFEEARSYAIRDLGIGYGEVEKAGIVMPVIKLEVNYKKAAFYDEELTIKVILKKMPTLKVVFDYEVYNPKNELLCNGQTVLICANAKTRRPIKYPEIMAKFVRPFFN